ncbi:DUF1176 domain-containing protein [Rhizobium rhizophilum]|uniref:DUF1176 domain-containing protein n=1 Tax=Rhizobium rhizophilum TaxID=1850373 RepID=A0ABY2R000_9HYPH|nr:DUF1176 domain-containing protein [Rhizobium rhizophilum]THV17173.1 DUF1176 domain-containing protein [Rhizobium rhizophilum]
MTLSRTTLTLAVFLGATLPVFAADGAFKEFRSWQVLCSQTLSCSMRQFLSDNGLSGFELQRAGGPEAPVVLVLSPSDSAIVEGDGDLQASITFDGAQSVTIPNSDIVADPNAATLSISGDFIGSGLIDSLKDGTTATITITRGTRTVEGDVTLAGAAASLLFIDEYQKRVGHVDAMSAKGDKAPNPAPPVSDIRRFADFPEAVRGRFTASGECADTEESMLGGNALAHKLGSEQTLYVTPCGMGGAYNFPYAVFLDSYGSVSTLAFPMMQDGAPSAATVAFNLDYDHEAKTFSAFFKGRGVGDCGTISQWKLVESGVGPQLVLIEEAFQDCPSEFNENDTVDVENWPKTWPLD